MARFRKKPIVIEAVQYTGWNHPDAVEFTGGQARDVSLVGEASVLAIKTLEGVMRANVGDWIIRGVQGEFYPCKPDIFEATYELAGHLPADTDQETQQ